VQGSHWAALINAHGCVGKDLDKAIAVFNSIEKHPSTLTSRARLPDAVAFEALINVFVTLRRTDLVPVYLERLQQSGVHMTAYIANLLIRGYAAAGNIEEARKVFESLADPPVGVAAPHNHAPHDSSVPPRISTDEFVYREVSFERVNLLTYANVYPSHQLGKQWFARSSAMVTAIMQFRSLDGFRNGMRLCHSC
jgi:pentatricopeptide repeat protein